MNLFSDAIIPLVAILILLALLLTVLVLVYKQKGVLLPFATQPDGPAENTVRHPNFKSYMIENKLIPNWRILK